MLENICYYKCYKTLLPISLIHKISSIHKTGCHFPSINLVDLQPWSRDHICPFFYVAVLQFLHSFWTTQLCCVNQPPPKYQWLTAAHIHSPNIGFSCWQLCLCSIFSFISGWKEITLYCDILSCGRLKKNNKQNQSWIKPTVALNVSVWNRHPVSSFTKRKHMVK